MAKDKNAQILLREHVKHSVLLSEIYLFFYFLGHLLHGFFKYYASYKFQTDGIAIHTTNVLTKEECRKAAIAVDTNNALKIDTAMLVQDPFKLSHNVAHNVNEAGLSVFLNYFNKYENNLVNCNDSKISLIELFTKSKENKQRKKQKRKRNRSNVYSISLPNCKHVSGSKSLCCYSYVMSVLTDDLRMRIIKESFVGEQSESLADQEQHSIMDTSVPGETAHEQSSVSSVLSKVQSSSETETVHDTLVPASDCRKRKLSAVEFESHDICKKAKLESVDKIDFVACAYVDTWTNRRKQRRLLHKIQHCDETNQQTSCDEKDETDSGIKMSEGSVIENRNSAGLTVCNESQELLRFNVTVSKAKSKNNVCRVTLDLVDNSRNIQDFQTFYAYFKKEIVTIFK